LPKAIPRIEGVDLAAFSVPALQIGGDYYDFVRVDDQRLGIAVADVSGKGVPAAIVMSLCRSLLRVKAPGCASPAEVLRMMNRMLSEDLGEDMFISMLYMVLDTRTRELAVARAGHLPPIVHPGGADAPWLVESRGIAIGMADIETFDSALAEKRATLAPGDTVVAYTDGVTEAQDDGGSEWGVLNLVKTIQITAIEGGGASGVADNVHQKLLRFTGEAPQHDDMTLVVMRMT
jgi:sigma-B regulation protein RsbU (phosphoserine phosphatase)